MSGDNYHVAYSFPIAGIFFQTYPILKKQVFANLFPLRAAVYLDTGIRTAGGRAADGTRGTDGGGKNLIARSPFCGKEGKFGSFIEGETARKETLQGALFLVRLFDDHLGEAARKPRPDEPAADGNRLAPHTARQRVVPDGGNAGRGRRRMKAKWNLSAVILGLHRNITGNRA